MKPKTAILGVLGLLIGLGAGFLIWEWEGGTTVVVATEPYSYSVLPDGREHTYVLFKKENSWYVSQAAQWDPLRPCGPPKGVSADNEVRAATLGTVADCTPMPPPRCPGPGCPNELEYWTECTPSAEQRETIGVEIRVSADTVDVNCL